MAQFKRLVLKGVILLELHLSLVHVVNVHVVACKRKTRARNLSAVTWLCLYPTFKCSVCIFPGFIPFQYTVRMKTLVSNTFLQMVDIQQKRGNIVIVVMVTHSETDDMDTLLKCCQLSSN